MSATATPQEARPRKQNALRDIELKQLKPSTKPFKVADGNGLCCRLA